MCYQAALCAAKIEGSQRSQVPLLHKLLVYIAGRVAYPQCVYRHHCCCDFWRAAVKDLCYAGQDAEGSQNGTSYREEGIEAVVPGMHSLLCTLASCLRKLYVQVRVTSGSASSLSKDQ